MMATVIKKNPSTILGPVSKKTLAEEVVLILKRFILTENLRTGDRLPPERKLAAAFGVSHRVVREALSILSGEGVVSKEHGRGVFVKAVARGRLQVQESPPSFFSFLHTPANLYEVRCAIEVGAVGIAAQHATADDLAELQAIIDVMTPKAERGESLVAEEIRFHQALLMCTHNAILQQFNELLAEAIRFKIYNDPDCLASNNQNPKTILEHQAIVDALRAGDSVRAMFEMYVHQRRLVEQNPVREEGVGGNGRGEGSPAE